MDKICTKCSILKPLTDYNMDRGKRQSRCRDCRSLEYYRNREHNMNKNKEFYKKRKEIDLNFRLRCNLRSQVSKIIRRHKKYKDSYVDNLSCGKYEFLDYIESLFQEGMTWGNYGRTSGVNGWEIDHIKPLKNYDLTNYDEFKEAAHYTNCRPLWAKENNQKKAK